MTRQNYRRSKLKSKWMIDFVKEETIKCIDCQRLQRGVSGVMTTRGLELQGDCNFTRTPSSMLERSRLVCICVSSAA